jgi:hypothetical protein
MARAFKNRGRNPSIELGRSKSFGQHQSIRSRTLPEHDDRIKRGAAPPRHGERCRRASTLNQQQTLHVGRLLFLKN